MSDKNYFAVLNAINVNDKTEKKNGLTYEIVKKGLPKLLEKAIAKEVTQ